MHSTFATGWSPSDSRLAPPAAKGKLKMLCYSENRHHLDLSRLSFEEVAVIEFLCDKMADCLAEISEDAATRRRTMMDNNVELIDRHFHIGADLYARGIPQRLLDALIRMFAVLIDSYATLGRGV